MRPAEPAQGKPLLTCADEKHGAAQTVLQVAGDLLSELYCAPVAHSEPGQQTCCPPAQVVLKKDVLDSAKRISQQRGAQLSLLGGDEWYKQQASRCVAAGKKVPVQGTPASACMLAAQACCVT